MRRRDANYRARRFSSPLSEIIMRQQFVKSGEWKLIDSRIEKSLEAFYKYRSQALMKYSVITFRFLLRREPTFYLVNVIGW